MKIGIVTNHLLPDSGGGYTLENTIIYDINNTKNKNHEFYFIINDSSSPKRYIKNNITYLNVYIRNKKHTLLYRIIKKIIRLIISPSFDRRITVDKILKKENIDLIWFVESYYFNTTIPFIFTVWDLGHRMLPCFPEVSISKYDDWEARENLYKNTLPKATFIITGNETGKKEILSNYTLNPEKIHIIPFPIPSFCFNHKNKNIQPSFEVKPPFIFYPAQFWAHKNHVVIVEAIAYLRDKKDMIINCYFAGSDKGNMEYIQKIINHYNLDNQIRIIGFVSLDELIYLYKNAVAMVFASFLGPNNLPPLEAAALGCPVLYSNIPGHVEQMEGAGMSFDPTNYIDLAESIYKLYNDLDYRNKMIKSELSFADKYRTYSYFNLMQKLFNQYNNYLKTWKN